MQIARNQNLILKKDSAPSPRFTDTQINPKLVIAILTVTSHKVINVPTRGLLAVETKDSFVLWLEKFKYQKTCL